MSYLKSLRKELKRKRWYLRGGVLRWSVDFLYREDFFQLQKRTYCEGYREGWRHGLMEGKALGAMNALSPPTTSNHLNAKRQNQGAM